MHAHVQKRKQNVAHSMVPTSPNLCEKPIVMRQPWKIIQYFKKKKKTHLYTQITNLTINLMRKIYYYTREASIGCRVLIINSTGLTHGYYRTNVNLVLLPVHKSIIGKPNPKNLFIKHLSFSHQPLGSQCGSFSSIAPNHQPKSNIWVLALL